MSEEWREAWAVTCLFAVMTAFGAGVSVGEGDWLVASGLIVLTTAVVLFMVKVVFDL